MSHPSKPRLRQIWARWPRSGSACAASGRSSWAGTCAQVLQGGLLRVDLVRHAVDARVRRLLLHPSVHREAHNGDKVSDDDKVPLRRRPDAEEVEPDTATPHRLRPKAPRIQSRPRQKPPWKSARGVPLPGKRLPERRRKSATSRPSSSLRLRRRKLPARRLRRQRAVRHRDSHTSQRLTSSASLARRKKHTKSITCT